MSSEKFQWRFLFFFITTASPTYMLHLLSENELAFSKQLYSNNLENKIIKDANSAAGSSVLIQVNYCVKFINYETFN